MRTATIVAFLSELVETHMLKCAESDMPHIASSTDKITANVSSIATDGNSILLTLNNGNAFTITIRKEA